MEGTYGRVYQVRDCRILKFFLSAVVVVVVTGQGCESSVIS
jgi:hypothetical protein